MSTPHFGTVADYYRALRAVYQRNPSSKRWQILLEHYNAPNHTTTWEKLADKVGMDGYRAINLHYGSLAREVADELGIGPEDIASAMGTDYADAWIFTLVDWAEDGKDSDDGTTLFVLRPQVVKALEQMGVARKTPQPPAKKHTERIAHYRRLLRYEYECIERVIASLESVPEDRRTEPLYERAVSLLAHAAAAQHLWLARLGKGSPPLSPFPSGVTAAEAADDYRESVVAWQGYLEECSDEDLHKKHRYTTIAGDRFSSTLEDILLHLFAHGAYHRGQIAMAVRALGGTPAVTDFIAWARQQ